MKIDDLRQVFAPNQDENDWEDVCDSYKVLHIPKRKSAKVRIVGPVYKAKRCFICNENSMAQRMSSEDLRKILNGTLKVPEVRFNPYDRYNQRAQRFNDAHRAELEVAGDRSRWKKCLLTTVVLLESNMDLPKNCLYYFVFPHHSVKYLVDYCKESKTDFAVLSGVKGININLGRGSGGYASTDVYFDPQISFLPMEVIRDIINNGFGCPKKWFLEQNQKNIRSKRGFFYTINNKKERSVIDKHMEPFEEVGNYIEEDRQFLQIDSSTSNVFELEEMDPFEITDL